LIKGRNDPVFFSKYFLGLELHDGQKLFLWGSTKTQKEQATPIVKKKYPDNWEQVLEYIYSDKCNSWILVPSNRWGKTMTAAVKHIYMLFYKIGLDVDAQYFSKTRYQTFNISPVSEQAMACYEFIMDILQSKFLQHGKQNTCRIGFLYKSHNKNTRTINMADNRRFRCATLGNDTKGATAIQGSNYGYGSFDECSEADRLKLEIPRMSSRLIDLHGPLDLLGTPSSESKSFQFHFHIARLGDKYEDGYFTIKGVMEDNIYLNKENVEAEKQEYKIKYPHLFRQVFYGDFVATGGKMFTSAEVERIWDRTIMLPDQGLPKFNAMEANKRIFSIDWGFAEEGDPSVGYVIDYSQIPYKMLFHFQERNADPWKIFAYVREIKEHFRCPIIMDTNAMGGNIIAKLLRDLKPIHFDFHGKTKEDALYLLKQALTYKRDYEFDEQGKAVDNNPEFGKLRSYYIPELEEQLGWYKLDDAKIEQDHVMSLAMAIYHIDRHPPLAKPRVVSLYGVRPTVSPYET